MNEKLSYNPVKNAQLCSYADAARALGVSRQAVSYMVKRGDLHEVGGKLSVLDVNWLRKERIRLAHAEYERLRDIPEIPAT